MFPLFMLGSLCFFMAFLLVDHIWKDLKQEKKLKT